MFNYCKLMRTTPKKKKCRKVYSGKVIFKIIKERVKKGLSLKSSTQTLSVLKTLLLTVTELLVRKIVLSRTDSFPYHHQNKRTTWQTKMFKDIKIGEANISTRKAMHRGEHDLLCHSSF